MSAILTGYANPTTPCFVPAGSGGGGGATAYGSFSSTQTQGIPAGDALPLVYDTADITAVGMSCVLPSTDITIAAAGVYKVSAAALCNRTGTLEGDVEMWITVNAVPTTAGRINIVQGVEDILSAEWLVNVDAGDIVNLVVFSNQPDNEVLSVVAAPPVPAVQSITTSIVRVA